MSCDCDCNVRVWLCGEQHLVPPDEDGVLNLTLDPTIRDYVGDAPDPSSAVPVVDAQDPGKIEAVLYARNSLGRVTHVGVCGSWVPLAIITTEATPGPTSDRVCYDLAGFSFPEGYSSGHGQWTVANVDRMAGSTCADQLFSLCIETSQRAEATDNGAASPVPDYSGDTWSSYPTGEGCGGAVRADTGAGSTNRDSVRLLPDYPAGLILDSPVVELEFRINSQGQNLGLSCWDPVTDTNLPLVSHSKPSGGSATQHADHLQMFNTKNGNGTWRAKFDTTGVDIQNVEFVFFAINSNGPVEDVESIRVNLSGLVSGSCFEFADIDAVASWMSSKDPFENVWFAEGSQVCTDAEIGTGAQYGAFEGAQDGPVIPTVT